MHRATAKWIHHIFWLCCLHGAFVLNINIPSVFSKCIAFGPLCDLYPVIMCACCNAMRTNNFAVFIVLSAWNFCNTKKRRRTNRVHRFSSQFTKRHSMEAHSRDTSWDRKRVRDAVVFRKYSYKLSHPLANVNFRLFFSAASSSCETNKRFYCVCMCVRVSILVYLFLIMYIFFSCANILHAYSLISFTL